MGLIGVGIATLAANFIYFLLSVVIVLPQLNLRFPKNKEYLTGFEYESWHYRYLGVDLATKVYESGLTYDEYYFKFIDNN